LKWRDNAKVVENQDAAMIAHKKVLEDRITQFYQAMDEDFNTAKAIGHLFGLVNYAQKSVLNQNVPISSDIYRLVIDFLDQIDAFFGFIKAFDTIIAENKEVGLVFGENNEESQILGVLIDNLLAYRLELKKAKNYQMADKLRALLKESGIEVVDTKDGFSWTLEKR
jgi:cysteinyl-tRNA synthetase